LNYSNFQWPEEIQLTRKLKDVLEAEVDEKYFLSEKMVNSLINNGKKEWSKCFKPHDLNDNFSDCITARYQKMGKTDPYIKIIGNTNPSGNGMNGNIYDENGISPTLSTNKGEGIKVGTWRTHKDGQGFRECEDGTCPTIPARAREDGSGQPVIKLPIKSNTQKGFDFATENDSINFSNPTSKTRRGRVGVAQTLDTSCNQGVIQLNQSKESNGRQPYQQNRIYDENGISPALCKDKSDLLIKNEVCIPVLTPDRPEKRQNGRRFKNDGEEMFTITTQDKHGIYDGYRIRRLTPTECFRLMDFPDSHVENARKALISDSQLYKQAGNSIVTKHLIDIGSKLIEIINSQR
jgi:DNA (cytosine-5)-methyltransferase 1